MDFFKTCWATMVPQSILCTYLSNIMYISWCGESSNIRKRITLFFPLHKVTIFMDLCKKTYKFETSQAECRLASFCTKCISDSVCHSQILSWTILKVRKYRSIVLIITN